MTGALKIDDRLTPNAQERSVATPDPPSRGRRFVYFDTFDCFRKRNPNYLVANMMTMSLNNFGKNVTIFLFNLCCFTIIIFNIVIFLLDKLPRLIKAHSNFIIS
ncbi:hypothetical protein GWI33_023341 [Rhynchophorus ferrugineus]|uniref:Uncharacterized protein n=1 Tax=Rhynchophorus ferrugineus TaxID=354439 RepID=A0A834IPM8_RHYFE|nr:hypothetical protein GWI33_023341 [Rhynchophorus ferrugineus]